jgi:hypothetical protein
MLEMEECLITEVHFKEAEEMADVVSLINDLDFVIKALDKLQQLIVTDSKERLISGSLWVAALINYDRCFSTGKRFGLSEELYEQFEGGVECHQMFVDIRNKHIAHSVNSLENVKIGLVLSPLSSQARQVIGVASLELKLNHLAENGINNLRILATFARNELIKQAKKYQQMVLEIGKQMNIDDLYSNARLGMNTPNPREAGLPRE